MTQEVWRREEELSHTTLERSPEAPQTFLDEACGEDTELRRQVGMPASKGEHAGRLLGNPAFADATVTPGTRGSLLGCEFGMRRLDRDRAMIGEGIRARGIGCLLRIFAPRKTT